MTIDTQSTDVRSMYGTPFIARVSVLALLVVVAASPWLQASSGVAVSIASLAPVFGVGYAFVLLLLSWLAAIETWRMLGCAGDPPAFHSCISWLYVFPADSPRWWERPLFGVVRSVAAVATGVALAGLF